MKAIYKNRDCRRISGPSLLQGSNVPSTLAWCASDCVDRRRVIHKCRFTTHRWRCLSHTLLQIFSKMQHIFAYNGIPSGACLGGAVGSVAVRAAWLRWSASLDSRHGLAQLFCQVIAAYALRLNSRAGTEGSTVSLICDRWLILGSETLSISRCLNH